MTCLRTHTEATKPIIQIMKPGPDSSIAQPHFPHASQTPKKSSALVSAVSNILASLSIDSCQNERVHSHRNVFAVLNDMFLFDNKSPWILKDIPLESIFFIAFLLVKADDRARVLCWMVSGDDREEEECVPIQAANSVGEIKG
jgi:hypothetical protein